MGSKEQLQEYISILEKEVKQYEIVLYNDEVNTFDHVIDTLIIACDHTSEQAEQCAIITHYNGKCTVKTGEYEELKARCSMLLDAGLRAKVEG